MSHPVSSALLLTAPGCAHCQSLKKILNKFLDEGLIKNLNVIDVTSQPEAASQFQIKSVPWLKLGDYEFLGSQSESDLRRWITLLEDPGGGAGYMKHLLETGELDVVINMIRHKPGLIEQLLELVIDEDKDMRLRLGISAVFEEFEGDSILQEVIGKLCDLASHQDPGIRADVAHYLSLYRNDQSLAGLYVLSEDNDREVSEIAREALNQLN